MQIKVPDMGVDSAEVSEILVKVGDTIAVNDNLVLLESDKASVEVPSTAGGKITAIRINLGDKVKEGDVILEVAGENTSDAIPAPAPMPSAPVVTTAPAQPVASTAQNSQSHFPLPDLGVDSAEVSEIMVKIGDTVKKDQPLVLVESDKASVEVPAPASGKIIEMLIKAGDKVKNGQDFIVIELEGAVSVTPVQNASATAQAPVSAPSAAPSTPAQSSTSSVQLNEQQVNARLTDIYAGPAVRKLSRQLGVDVSQIEGSGSKGRVSKDDIFAFVKQRMQSPVVAPQATTGAVVRSGLPNLPDMSKTEIWGEIETQDLTRLQKVSIPQLNYNTYLPQVTQFDLADITDVEQMRNDIKEEMKKQGVSLTILAFIMKAVAYAIGEHPKFNSHLSDDNTQILIRKSVHMGFAVATPTGLMVPVIKDVQTKGIKQIALEVSEMAVKARDGKLAPKDMTGASFTISSQGNLGGTSFTPLVTWPQVAILGVSESTLQSRWNAQTKTFEPRLMLPLSLSYDHRVINGADAAVFTRFVAKLLADPRRILL